MFNRDLMKFKIRNFNGILPYDSISSKKYNKKIVNKWNLLVRLTINKELIAFRCYQNSRNPNHILKDSDDKIDDNKCIQSLKKLIKYIKNSKA